jgi:hypothetical protein
MPRVTHEREGLSEQMVWGVLVAQQAGSYYFLYGVMLRSKDETTDAWSRPLA